jgi:flagellar motor switch/type III secretory pathway protein FliN
MSTTEISSPPEATGNPTDRADYWASLLHVRASISVEAAIVGLTVRELFRLEKGSILVTEQASTTNVPLCTGGTLIAWVELEVAGENLAARLAELA